MTDAQTVWANETFRFWGASSCYGLFLLFDTSAHIHDGSPDVSAQDVVDHIRDCEECQESDVRVSELSDGTFQLESHEVD
jgi:hypothetical protein